MNRPIANSVCRLLLLEGGVYEATSLSQTAIRISMMDPASSAEGGGEESAEFSFGAYVFALSRDGSFVVKKGRKPVIEGRLYGSGRMAASHAGNRFAESLDGPKKTPSPAGGVSFVFAGPVYGLGDKTGPLDKAGYDYLNYNTDDPSAQVDTFKSLYKSIPFFTMFQGEDSVGVFLDNSGKTFFDFEKRDPKTVTASYLLGGMDLYLFFGSLLDVSRQFSRCVGTGPLPPRWALGYQQSRWSYGSEEECDEVIAGYKKAGIPLSALYLDIAYMDRYMDFTVDEKRFPSFPSWVAAKRREGVRIVPIIDAGLKALPGYFMYDEGLRNGFLCTLGGEAYHNEVWPGDSVFPAFMDEKTQDWWASHVESFLLKSGVSGIWNDMNEPASFLGPLPDEVDMGGMPHAMAHNLYAEKMDRATCEGFLRAKMRPFIVTRAAYARTAHYAASWTGDNQSIWDHLRLTIPQLANMALSGIEMTGNDIGGFSGDATKELLIRWIELGVFSPLMRNHSAFGTKRQEGYAFDDETTGIYRKAVSLRYELISYFYDLLREHEETGSPVYRPLIANFPADPLLRNENTEAMLGASLLFAPALFPGERCRSVYFPSAFYDYFSGRRYGKGYHLIDVPLEAIPLFVRENSIVPIVKGNPTTEYPKTLSFLVTGEEGSYTHYEDSGDGLSYRKGEYNLYRVANRGGKCSCLCLHEGMKSHYEKVEFIRLDKKG
ncbi:MAG: DUF5110 domain-containing protein [Bacilli bacterium]|nr:DUF5110 domain-containing protein [Bacilli bacterium]